jgi:hypothetical protein
MVEFAVSAIVRTAVSIPLDTRLPTLLIFFDTRAVMEPGVVFHVPGLAIVSPWIDYLLRLFSTKRAAL